jgi:hypothetical protein
MIVIKAVTMDLAAWLPGGEQFQPIELLALVCERVVVSYFFGALCQLSERSRSKAASWKAAAPDEMSEVLAMNGAMPKRGRSG